MAIYTNSFFQVIIQNGTYLKIFPAQPDGEKLDAREIAEYLDEERIFGYDISVIHKAIKESDEIVELPISVTNIYPIDEKMQVTVSPDNLIVEARFYPPSNGGSLLSAQDIIRLLNQKKIKYGIQTKTIRQFLHKRQYCTTFIVAKGEKARSGKDASIEYHFDTELKAKPTILEDGSVDFHHLDAINHTAKDSLLATLHPADIGDVGKDVFGNELYPSKVKQYKLKFGKNIYESEDHMQIFSSIDGHVHLEGERVVVSDTYEVLGDVDASTGDIDYDGNIDIKGTVRTGYTIRATGDINVKGVVEGANLYAGGQVVIQRGIQGMNKGTVECDGNLFAKFIENSKVKTKSGVVTEAIMHSDVLAQGNVIVDGRKGLITGGKVSSRSMIEMKVGGSDMGTVTKLEVGADPEIMEKCHYLTRRLPELQRDMEKNQKIIDMYSKRLAKGDRLSKDKIEVLKKAKQDFEDANEEFTNNQGILEHYQDLISANSNGMIKVSSVLYPGVEVTISDISMHVREEIRFSRLVREGADIRVKSY